MINIAFLGTGPHSYDGKSDAFPAQFYVYNKEFVSEGVLIGASPYTTRVLHQTKTPIDVCNRIFILNLLNSQTGYLEQLALDTFYGETDRTTLYVPEALLDGLWAKLAPTLGAIAATRYKRVNIDAYFNIISLSESNAVVYSGDLELYPCRVPSPPGIPCYGLFIKDSATAKTVMLSPSGKFTAADIRALYKMSPNTTLVVAIDSRLPMFTHYDVFRHDPGLLNFDIYVCGEKSDILGPIHLDMLEEFAL